MPMSSPQMTRMLGLSLRWGWLGTHQFQLAIRFLGHWQAPCLGCRAIALQPPLVIVGSAAWTWVCDLSAMPMAPLREYGAHR